jgi:hypothetical protein
MPEAAPEDIKSERFIEIYDWLHSLILSPAYQKLLKVWALVRPEIWEGYAAHGVKGLQEQILLEKAQIEIRKTWKRNRPFFFGRKFKVKEGSASENENPENQTESQQDGDSEVSPSGDVRPEGKRPAKRNRRRGRRKVLRAEGAGSASDDAGIGE